MAVSAGVLWLRAARMLVEREGEMDRSQSREDGEMDDDMDNDMEDMVERYDTRLDELTSEIDTLRAENAALREIVATVATEEMAWESDAGDRYCIFECDLASGYHHNANCPVTRARALLGQ
jgi:predicted RNase H-like nuclease (RuvC/YqgF family)